MELLDVTLREGEQRAGSDFSVEQKVAASRELDALGVEYVQVGFPVADDRTRRVCERVDLDAKTTGIARAIEGDVSAADDADVDVIDLFAPTSDAQREYMLGSNRDGLLATIREMVERARETGREVHFTAMDGFRTDVGFLDRLLDAVDAEWVSIADTVGSQTPGSVVETLDALDANLDRVGVHFHDDLGVATANALAAAERGVGKVDVSVGGLGERAGNTPLEEFVVAGALGSEAIETTVDDSVLLPQCRAVLDILDESVPRGKPLLGNGVFEHESGLHTAAMLSEPGLFEPFDPARFGGERRLLFGPASGRGAARGVLERAGVVSTDENVATLLAEFHDREENVGLDEALAMAHELD